MYTLTMDFDRGEMRIPKDVVEALDMPLDFSYLVHRGNRQMVITRYIDPAIAIGEKQRGPKRRKSRVARYWNEDAAAYCVTVVSGTLQLIGNLITGFNGSGIYTLPGCEGAVCGEVGILFDLAQAALTQSVQ